MKTEAIIISEIKDNKCLKKSPSLFEEINNPFSTSSQSPNFQSPIRRKKHLFSTFIDHSDSIEEEKGNLINRNIPDIFDYFTRGSNIQSNIFGQNSKINNNENGRDSKVLNNNKKKEKVDRWDPYYVIILS